MMKPYEHRYMGLYDCVSRQELLIAFGEYFIKWNRGDEDEQLRALPQMVESFLASEVNRAKGV